MLVDTGDVAPPIVLLDHDGQQWRLADRRGRSVILVFHRHLM
jgi:peroxiredoxin